MLDSKAAKKQIKAVKKAVTSKINAITPNEKIAGAAVIGAAVGAAATALGTAMLHQDQTKKQTKPSQKSAG